MNPPDLKYSKEHEWVRTESDSVVVVGITEFAQDNLGDVVFVEIPDVDAQLTQGEKMGEIESVKAVSDLYSPVSGKVVERNESLIDNPELVNEGPFEQGWMLKVELDDASGIDTLLSADDYQSFLDNEV
ncbi:MAG: glycine cleavage system protein GcvH [SAR202 cluster bacterium]|nr:glycine cleavage system protein GcvH [SAR202 cluster bacterium]